MYSGKVLDISCSSSCNTQNCWACWSVLLRPDKNNILSYFLVRLKIHSFLLRVVLIPKLNTSDVPPKFSEYSSVERYVKVDITQNYQCLTNTRPLPFDASDKDAFLYTGSSDEN